MIIVRAYLHSTRTLFAALNPSEKHGAYPEQQISIAFALSKEDQDERKDYVSSCSSHSPLFTKH